VNLHHLSKEALIKIVEDLSNKLGEQKIPAQKKETRPVTPRNRQNWVRGYWRK
jgi:hypothetical protein